MKENATKAMNLRWAWKRLREFLKEKCIEIETYKLGDMKYCLEQYFKTVGKKKPNKKSSLILLQEYNDKKSPIFRGIKVTGISLEKKSKQEKRKEYNAYLKSPAWKEFKRGIIKDRGDACENCGAKPKQLDLHHKTYARLFKELPCDVMLLCRPCHDSHHFEEKFFIEQKKERVVKAFNPKPIAKKAQPLPVKKKHRFIKESQLNRIGKAQRDWNLKAEKKRDEARKNYPPDILAKINTINNDKNGIQSTSTV